MENLEKTFFYRKKIQLQVFKIGGFGDKKMFRKSFETSLIISLIAAVPNENVTKEQHLITIKNFDRLCDFNGLKATQQRYRK